jgi:methionyl-tRNA synthetase
MNKKILIGLAWPYANGSLHLGHASAFIGADILARYHRLAENKVLFVSGSDCYGTPIAVEAAEKGIPPSEIANKYHEEFKKTLIDGLSFSYDIYTSTTTDQHTKVVQELFLDLYKKGFLYTKIEKALYSPLLERFLPDRFVEGTCPKCGYDSARGDQCDECGTLLDPLELKNPKINPKILKREKELSNNDLRLEVRESEHFYLKLTSLQKDLENWIEETSGSWRMNASSFAKGFLRQGLKDRAITRDTEWGVPIPLPGYETKRIYVWFEAVVGYLSASKLWSEERRTPDEWKDWWKNDEAIHYYVHGKDNIPFHTIIWPALLLAEGTLNTPNYIISSEYLNLEGKQFSKSRGWAVWLPEFLEAFDGETLRYFLVVNGPETSDANFTWSEFAQRVNGELIGTFGNLVNRVLSFSHKEFPEKLFFPEKLDSESQELLSIAKNAFPKVGELIAKGKFRAAFRVTLEVAEHGNRYINSKEPWLKIKDETKRNEVEADLAVLIQLIRTLAILINPFLPKTSNKIYNFLELDFQKMNWGYPEPETKWNISKISPLYQKIEDEEIEKQLAKLHKLIKTKNESSL